VEGAREACITWSSRWKFSRHVIPTLRVLTHPQSTHATSTEPGETMLPRRTHAIAVLALLGLTLGACAHSPVVTPAGPASVAYPATEPDQVRFYGSETVIPFEYVSVATITPRKTLRDLDDAELQPFRVLAAKRGANGLALDRAPDGRARFIAVRLTATPRTRERTSAMGDTASKTRSGTSSSAAPGGCVGSCDVQVRGYTRRDGTYVRPHTRSRPGGSRRRN
jgi:hypothetical protein